jgi:Protein of unknown function (DUF664)
MDFPGPSQPAASTGEVFVRYLDFFRATVADKVTGLDEASLRSSAVPSGWAPLELVKHLVAMERRWLVWGFEGEAVDDPWFDQSNGRWYAGPDETVEGLVEQLHAGGRRTRTIVENHRLDEVGEPGPRWGEHEPATLERVLFHVLQEYARHVGHLDIVRELADGAVGE